MAIKILVRKKMIMTSVHKLCSGKYAYKKKCHTILIEGDKQ